MQIVKASAVIEAFTPNLLEVIEAAARTCYRSEDRIGPGTAEKLIRSLMERETPHESVIEHGAITVRFINDRGISHEEVRHRLSSFSQESTRYCNYDKDKFGSEITVIDIKGGFPNAPTDWMVIWLQACQDAERHYMALVNAGAPAQFARSVLPNSLKTELVWTANPREWRHIFKMRTSAPAHPQVREVMNPLLEEFKKRWPPLFDDLPAGIPV